MSLAYKFRKAERLLEQMDPADRTGLQRICREIRDAQAALHSGDPRSFYDRIVASITHALDARLGEPIGGLPHTELRARLTGAGFDNDLIQRVVNELEGADFARFAASGVNKDEMQRCLQRTTAIIERVQRAKGTA